MSDEQAADPTDGEGEHGIFTGRHVVVSGGTGFLGSAVVARLLGAGATCHVPSWNASELERFSSRDHPRAHVVTGVDLTDPSAVDAFYAGLPGLWASIHCAGGFAMGPIGDTGADDYRRQMAMNAESCFYCCRAAVASIRGRVGDDDGVDDGGGRIVNVAARPALEPRTGASMVPYTMAKAAVAALTQALAEELASEGIWVNAIAPSIIDTPANRQAMPDADHGAWPSVDDLAATLLFLASPDNRSTRGAIVPVYGRS